MARKSFQKTALSSADLVAFLRSKGLSVTNEPYAVSKINSIGYYRLKIYNRPLENSNKTFKAGATFDDIVRLYEFDRNLRLITLDAIERIEVALRATIINIMCAAGGPHFYYDEVYFDNKSSVDNARTSVTDIRLIATKSKHLSITHYTKTYDQPHLPPIWCVMEGSTFGNVSRLFADLKSSHRKDIARPFGIDEAILVSWFKSINGVRNICAHHNRFWNADILVDKPKISNSIRPYIGKNNNTCYSRMVIMRSILNGIDKDYSDDWAARLKDFMNNNTHVNASAMGFIAGWQSAALWN